MERGHEASAPTGSRRVSVAEQVFDRDRVPDDQELAIGQTLEHVNIAAETAARARSVLLLLASAAVTAFAAFWNLDHTFIQRRIGVMQAALEAGSAQWGNGCTQMQGGKGRHCTELSRIWTQVRHELELRRGDTVGEAVVRDSLAAALDRLRSGEGGDVRTMKLPVLDVTFDVTDLWLFTGLGFALLLLVLAYTVSCEHRDIVAALNVARRLGTARMCYGLLAMRPTLPLPSARPKRFDTTWRWLGRSLYVIPLFVQGYATRIVYEGRNRTVDGVPEVTEGGWWLQGMILLLTLGLTAAIYLLETQYVADWKHWTAEVASLGGDAE